MAVVLAQISTAISTSTSHHSITSKTKYSLEQSMVKIDMCIFTLVFNLECYHTMHVLYTYICRYPMFIIKSKYFFLW